MDLTKHRSFCNTIGFMSTGYIGSRWKVTRAHRQLSLPVTLTIQSMYSETLVYTPGSIGRAHPSPWLTMPATYHLFRLFGSLQSNGPPLSPWQVSCPPLRYPAHISLPSMSVWCVHSARIGTSTSRMLSAENNVEKNASTSKYYILQMFLDAACDVFVCGQTLIRVRATILFSGFPSSYLKPRKI